MTVSGTLPDTLPVVDFAKLTERNRERTAFADEAIREGWRFLGYCGHIDYFTESGHARNPPAVCGLPQARCPAGPVCARGHGGANTLDETDRPLLKREAEMARTRRKKSTPTEPEPEPKPEGRDVTREDLDDPGFEVREGDRLTVVYGGVKLQIAPYSSVEIDSAYYSRTLEPGDDPHEQFDRIRAFLNKKTTEKAREKLALYAGELAAAKRKARGHDDDA